MYKYTFLSMGEEIRHKFMTEVPNRNHYTVAYAQVNKDVVKFAWFLFSPE